MNDGNTGALLGHLAEIDKKMTHVCFSPVPELALFFGMTSAETGEVQVGFRRRAERCGSALLSYGYQFTHSASFTELCTVHSHTWCSLGTENLLWVYRKAALSWKSRTIPDWFTCFATTNHTKTGNDVFPIRLKI